MKTIHKFQLLECRRTTFAIPERSTILTLQVQRNIPCLWFVVYNDQPTRNRTFEIVPTGEQVPSNLGYIGTFQLDIVGHVFVGHVFEV